MTAKSRSKSKPAWGRFSDKFEAKLDASVASITPFVDHVMQLIHEMDCVQGKEFEIETALREALANAIVHGAREDTSKQVECALLCDESRGVLIIVRDPGEGFDPDSIPDPLEEQNLLLSHGRGIYLINQLMDEIRFERGGTEIHMHKK